MLCIFQLGRKALNKFEKHQRAFAERKKSRKQHRAVGISVEGRNMAL
jgi:transcription factor SPN1